MSMTKHWIKHFAKFLLWVGGGMLFGQVIYMTPLHLLPYLMGAVLIIGGAYFSYKFAKIDYDHEQRKSERVMETLKKDF